MNHLIDILQLSTQEIDELVEKAKDIIANPEAYSDRKSTRLNSSHWNKPRMPSSA